MDPTHRLLAIVLGVQVVLLLILHPPFARRGAAGTQTLLPALASITPQKIQIAGGDGASVTLVRTGGAWCLEQPAGYPVVAGKAEKLIQDLGHLSAGRQVVSGSRYHAALKVADGDYQRRLRIWEKPEGNPKLELFVGTSPGSDLTHMRVGGADRVFEVAGMSAYDFPADAGSWIERNLVGLRADDVSALEVTNRRGSFALAKQAGVWAVRAPAARASARLDQTKVSELVGALCSATLDQPAGAVNESAQGLAAPEATLVFERAPSRPDSTAVAPGIAAGAAPAARVTVRIGALVPGKQGERYATRSDLGFAVTVPQYYVDRPDTVSLKDLAGK